MMDDRRPALEEAFDSPSAKRNYVRRLFGTIAGRYDLITRVLSFGRDAAWKRRALRLCGIERGRRVLDLACGTGDLAYGAAALGGRVIGLDLAQRMVELAKLRRGAPAVAFLVGDMTALPISSVSVRVVTTGYGLRNVPNLPQALSEILRVLEPGGTFCSLDFNRPSRAWVRAIFLGYLDGVGSVLGWLLHRDPDTYRYIAASIRRYPGAQGVADLLRSTGFVDVEHQPVFGGLMAIHLARKPQAT